MSRFILFIMLLCMVSIIGCYKERPVSGIPPFELSEITISQLQQAYANGDYTVRKVVELYLDRIEKIDDSGPELNAVILINPDALAIADSLDHELAAGESRGPLHGIPVLLKDNIDTHDKMPTTAGSRVLKDSYPPQDSWVAKKLREAGAVILGGHTISDDELKYGLAVTGLVHPEKVLTNAQAQPGDLLVLTKPIGTGAITTMLKNGSIDNTILNAATESMTRLNKSAMEACLQISVNAVTDVSGFGLLGHALEMAKASNVSLSLTFANVPILTGAIEAIKAGGVPGGTKANFLYTAADVDYAASLSKEEQWLLNDPQTSGGLLVSVSENKAAAFVPGFIDDGANAAIIGTVEAKERDKIRVRP